MRAWIVAAGLIEGDEGIVLVLNRRRDGSLDWSPPGGVIEVHDGESVTDGLTREVQEETGLIVDDWEGPVYAVEVTALDLGWTLLAETFVARAWRGELTVADPDGIVVDARFVAPELWSDHLQGTRPWVREPIEEWLAGPGGVERVAMAALAPARFRYRIDGNAESGGVVRLP